MQREVLDYLLKQGGLSLFAFPGEDVPYEALQKIALALNAGAHFILLDFSNKNESNINYSLADLFKKILSKDDIVYLKNLEQSSLLFCGYESLPDSEESFRIFYHNLELLKTISIHVLGILPSELPNESIQRIFTIAQNLIFAGKNETLSAAYIEDLTVKINIPILWFLKKLPNNKIYPKAFKYVKSSYSKCSELKKIEWQENPEKIANYILLLKQAEILKKNPLDGFWKLFRKFFLIILILVFFIPFVIPSNVDELISNVRDRISERDKLSIAPSFDYTFDGKETMQRISRYAIGKFNALITNEKMVKDYVELTLEENGYTRDFGLENIFNIPPNGTVIKFSKPEFIEQNNVDSIGSAWKYWTSIVSDSIAYLTEFYHEKASPTNRLHNGIDLASRKGARILAPFSAKAWTSKDERGGIIIGLVRKKDVMIFMHCDQLLYLDGQEVIEGDPIATVGVTGHTTGPHAHIVTGIIDPKGTKRIGNVTYKIIDPMEWYFKFKPKH